MKRILWSDRANADLRNIADYYGQYDPDLPYRLLQRIDRAPLILLDYPQLGSPTRRRGIRKWPVKGSPFLLFYRLAGTDLEIVHVIHNRRGPS